jgi:hypothetical protein
MEKEPAIDYRSKEESLKIFQVQIAELKRQEKEKGEEGNFIECNPDELEKEDKEIYEKLLSNDLNIKELRKYKNRVMKSGNKSRIRFGDYLANIFMIKDLEK